jgi:hypothetical protein
MRAESARSARPEISRQESTMAHASPRRKRGPVIVTAVLAAFALSFGASVVTAHSVSAGRAAVTASAAGLAATSASSPGGQPWG